MDNGSWTLLHPITGAGTLGFVLFASLPALYQLWIKARFARRNRGADGDGSYETVPQLFESADGRATAESMAAFSDRKPRIAVWISLLLGFTASIVSAILLSIDPNIEPNTSLPANATASSPSSSAPGLWWLHIVDTWVDVPTWGLGLLQCVSIPTKSQYDRRFLLATIGFWSGATMTISILVRHGFGIVLALSGRGVFGYKGTAVGAAICWLLEVLCALAASLSFASFPHRPDVYYRGGLVDQQHAVSRLSLFGFTWNRVVFDTAHERKLELEDLPDLDGDTRSSSVLAKYVASDGSAGGNKGRLWWQLVKAYRWPLFLQWTLTFVRSILALFPQYVLYQFLEGLDKHREKNKTASPQLWGWAISLGISLVLQVWVNSIQRWLTASRLEAPVSSLIQALIFQKALHLDEAAEPGQTTVGGSAKASDAGKKGDKEEGRKGPKDTNSGDIRQSVVNHMKLDSGRMTIFCTYNYWIPLAVFKLILAGTALSRLLGWTAFFSGLGCSLLVYPISQVMSKKYASIQFGLMKYRDAKAHVLTEALQGMRQIKYSALEKIYEKKILDSRNEELGQFWRVAKWMFGLSLVITTGPILLSCVSLAVYTLTTPTHVRASVIFASLGLFDQLDEAIGYLPLIQVYLMEAWTSCVRVEKYLNQPDKPPVSVPGEGIVFEDATFRWPRAEDASLTAVPEALLTSPSSPALDAQPSPAGISSPESQEIRSALRDVTLSFPSERLSLVTGKTGSGKSLLLAAILGEVRLLSGTVKVPEAPSVSTIESREVSDTDWVLPSLTAFVSQTPWVESGTLKENILFGMPFRELRYQKVLQACALEKDIELFPDGDATEVGPKGVTLSGGQRWRVALARALYSRAGILIFDDVLSAVDAHVGRIIVEEALSGDLARGRTRILATHHHEMCLSHASYLVRLESGRVGSVEQVEHFREPSVSETVISAAEEDSQEVDADRLLASPVVEIAAKTRKDKEGRETGRVKNRVYREYIKASNSVFLWVAIMVCIVGGRLVGVATTWSLKELAGSYQSNEIYDSLSSYRHISQSAQPELIWHAAILPFTAAITSRLPEDDSVYRQTALFWISAYVVFEVCSLLVGANTQLLIMFTGLRASRVFFERMTHSILHAPLRWIDTIPSGRILNRFTSDTFIVDRRLASDLGTFLSSTFVLIVIIATSISISPYIIVFGLLLLLVYGRIAVFYITAAREVKRINSVAYSPVYDQFSSVLTGLSTIRAFKRSEFYMDRMFGLIDSGTKASWAMQLLARWMNFRMGMFGATFVTVVATCIIFGNISASLAGFGLIFALRYTSALSRLLANVTSVELGFNAAERILEYIEIDTEQETGLDAPAAWPSRGHVEVEDLTASYAPELPPVLKALNFEALPGERIGVVGRTGAGKSTLAAVFFRLLEPKQGCIRIDGIDIATLKLDQLRSRLAIIPQDPFLFAGTLRSNLDLDGSIDDYDLHQVLKRVHLVEAEDENVGLSLPDLRTAPEASASQGTGSQIIEEQTQEEVARLIEYTLTEPTATDDIIDAQETSTMPVASESETGVNSWVPEGEDNGTDEANASNNRFIDDGNSPRHAFKDLDMPVSTGGGNLSQGQRQLVCLARALLTRPKIVVLDEATSAVDHGTDIAIQESLRREFASGGCTVLVIAHRLSTVVDFDRIIVLKEGRITEMGTPKELMKQGMALDERRKRATSTAREGESSQAAAEESSLEKESTDKGTFWELVKQSAEKEKLVGLVFKENAKGG